MMFKTNNVPAYKLPLLVIVIAVAAVMTLPAIGFNWARRQVCGVRF